MKDPKIPTWVHTPTPWWSKRRAHGIAAGALVGALPGSGPILRRADGSAIRASVSESAGYGTWRKRRL